MTLDIWIGQPARPKSVAVTMSKFLRGKKTSLKNFTENFTKVPNIIIHAEGLSPVDKLILIELQSYSTRPGYTLAYSRMADDLKLDKSNFLKRWRQLVERGIIIDGVTYTINYDMLGGLNPPNDKVVLNHQTTNQGGSIPPNSGSLKPPSLVVSHHLEGGLTPPIEEDNKEKEEEIKNKKEEKAKEILITPEHSPRVGGGDSAQVVTKEMVLDAWAERPQIKIKIEDGYGVFYTSSPSNGKRFKGIDFKGMLEYIKEFPSQSSLQGDSDKKSSTDSKNTLIKENHFNENVITNTSTGLNQQHKSIKLNQEDQSIKLNDGDNCEPHGSPSTIDVGVGRQGGDELRADDQLLSNVLRVVNHMRERAYKFKKHIPTSVLVEGLTGQSTDDEITKHIIERYNIAENK